MMESKNKALAGKAALVTGGAKRVGAAICRRLHGQGANLMLHHRASVVEAPRCGVQTTFGNLRSG